MRANWKMTKESKTARRRGAENKSRLMVQHHRLLEIIDAVEAILASDEDVFRHAQHDFLPQGSHPNDDRQEHDLLPNLQMIRMDDDYTRERRSSSSQEPRRTHCSVVVLAYKS